MSEHPALQPEDEPLDSPQPSYEAIPDALPAKSEFDWVKQVAFFAFLVVVSTALFYPTAQRYRTIGATRSAHAEQAERIRQIAEAQRLADESDATR